MTFRRKNRQQLSWNFTLIFEWMAYSHSCFVVQSTRGEGSERGFFPTDRAVLCVFLALCTQRGAHWPGVYLEMWRIL